MVSFPTLSFSSSLFQTLPVFDSANLTPTSSTHSLQEGCELCNMMEPCILDPQNAALQHERTAAYRAQHVTHPGLQEHILADASREPTRIFPCTESRSRCAARF